jgi:L-lactate dehydrogenase complex protein LldG
MLVDGIDAARARLGELLAERRPESALVWRHELLERLRLGELLAELEIAALDYDALAKMPREARRTITLSASVGITSADFAIAETGTLAVFSRPGQERLASLAPPLHVAVIERRQILPDLFDLFARLDGSDRESAGNDRLPSNLALITGPSKTGDIELQLTTGVHGPGEWHVIVIGA